MTPAQLRRLADLEQRAGRLAAPAEASRGVDLTGLPNDALDRLEGLSWAWPDRSPIPAEVILACVGRQQS